MVTSKPMTRPLYKSWTPWWLVGILLVATGFYYTIDMKNAYELVNSMVMATTIGVAIGFSRDAYKCATRHPWEWESDDAAIIAMFVGSIGLVIIFAGLWALRVTDDQWYRTNLVFFLGRVLLLSSTMLMLTATGAVEGRIPPASYMRTGKIIAAAVAFAFIVISLGY